MMYMYVQHYYTDSVSLSLLSPLPPPSPLSLSSLPPSPPLSLLPSPLSLGSRMQKYWFMVQPISTSQQQYTQLVVTAVSQMAACPEAPGNIIIIKIASIQTYALYIQSHVC